MIGGLGTESVSVEVKLCAIYTVGWLFGVTLQQVGRSVPLWAPGDAESSFKQAGWNT